MRVHVKSTNRWTLVILSRTYFRTWATVFGPYHCPIGFPSPTPIWAAAFNKHKRLSCELFHWGLNIIGRVWSSLLTNLMDGIIAVFFVDEGVENTDVLLSLFLASGPSPVWTQKGQLWNLPKMSPVWCSLITGEELLVPQWQYLISANPQNTHICIYTSS